MPRASAFSKTPEASSGLYMRTRLPQQKARRETEAPVRPSVRWGMVVAAETVREPPARAAAAPTAMPLRSRNSRRLTLSVLRIVVSCLSGRLHAGRGQVFPHHLRVVRERDLRLLDVGM